ncbi:MAG: hypothetical protein ACRDRI_17045 [Pseudonocardiaceae bacterium]
MTGDVRGGEVIYPGPARIVLAAAAQLRDTPIGSGWWIPFG